MRYLLGAALLWVALAACAQRPGEGLTPVNGKPQAPDFHLTDAEGNSHLVRALPRGDAFHAAGLGAAASGGHHDARHQRGGG